MVTLFNSPVSSSTLISSEHEINDLLKSFSRGEEQAYERIFQTAWPLVLRHCRRLLPQEQDAEDAAQEALLRVLTRIDEFDAERSAIPWMLGIARYQALTVRKRRTRRRESALSEAPSSTQPDPESRAIHRERLEALRCASQMLNENERRLLGWRPDGDDGRPLDAVARKRRQRARTRLRRHWRAALLTGRLNSRERRQH